MTRIPHARRWLSVAARTARRAGHRWQPPPPGPPDPWADGSWGADTFLAGGWASFRRIVPIPFAAWLVALERWQLTGPSGELRLGPHVLLGPAEHDPHFGTCRIQVRLVRGPLRPPARMRLGIDHWSATATVLELIPYQPVQPTAAYFRAGHQLLDALAHALPQPAHAQAQPGTQTQHLSLIHI